MTIHLLKMTSLKIYRNEYIKYLQVLRKECWVLNIIV